MKYAGKVLMLVENQMPQDPRVNAESQLLSREGYKVTVIALKKKGQKSREDHDGVIIYRLPQIELFSKDLDGSMTGFGKTMARVKGFVGYFFEYVYFSAACLFLSLYILGREGFDVIHAHNPPDTLFVVGAFYKLFGKKFVFDHHDLSPELYRAKYHTDRNVVYRALALFERLSIRFSDVTIATNESYKQIQVRRGGIRPEDVYVVRNGPDLRKVTNVVPDERLEAMDKTILGYCGRMCPQDGVDYLLRSLWVLAYEMKRTDFVCVLMGEGDSYPGLKKLAVEMGLGQYVDFKGYVPYPQMVRYLAAADICVDPDPSSPSNDASTFIKIMEYMALGKPIVAYDLKETRFSAKDAAIYVEPNDEKAFAREIARLMDDPGLRHRMGQYGKARFQAEFHWDIVGRNLLTAYSRLLPGKNILAKEREGEAA